MELLLTDVQTAFLKKQSDQEEKRAKEFNQQIHDVVIIHKVAFNS